MVLGALLSVVFGGFAGLAQKWATAGVVCGVNVSHDTQVVYEVAEGTKWHCVRCDAEGWEPSY
jgi:hypothetical protein